MSKQWSEDQYYLLFAIDEYRKRIKGKELKEARLITREFAKKLHENTSDLQHRTIESINQRLPYLDNLLAGALHKENYAIKDQELFATKFREDGDCSMNECNWRHSYKRENQITNKN